MTLTDVLADMFQGLGIPVTQQRLGFYAQVVAEGSPNVTPEQLAVACRDAVRDTQRACPSPRELLAALAKAAPSASSEANRDARRDAFRRVLEACEDATRWTAEEIAEDPARYSVTPLARRVAWLEVQARRQGIDGEMARLLLDRERRALHTAQDADRDRADAQRSTAVQRAAFDPPPIAAG